MRVCGVRVCSVRVCGVRVCGVRVCSVRVCGVMHTLRRSAMSSSSILQWHSRCKISTLSRMGRSLYSLSPCIGFHFSPRYSQRHSKWSFRKNVQFSSLRAGREGGREEGEGGGGGRGEEGGGRGRGEEGGGRREGGGGRGRGEEGEGGGRRKREGEREGRLCWLQRCHFKQGPRETPPVQYMASILVWCGISQFI